jgi:hypothetical protein
VTSKQRIARRRGRDLEYRVARALGGTVWTGQDGDVDARGFRFECKYRRGWQLQHTREVLDWLKQVERYRDRNPEIAFALVFWGGGRKFEPLVCIPLSVFDRLTCPDSQSAVRPIVERIYPDLKRIVSVLEQERQERTPNDS